MVWEEVAAVGVGDDPLQNATPERQPETNGAVAGGQFAQSAETDVATGRARMLLKFPC
jgi:hypothetical protein